MSTAAAQAPTVKITERRSSWRHPLTVPLDVTLLRSGIPDRVPGRMLNLSEYGLEMIVAADLQHGDIVGIEFHLSSSSGLTFLKARVRHLSLLRYGLEFLDVSREQRTRIRCLFQQDSVPLVDSLLSLATPDAEAEPVERFSDDKTSPWPRRLASVRWIWIFLFPVVLIAGGGWWRWRQGWSQLESRLPAGKARVATLAPFGISEDTAERLLIYRVEPLYPEDTRQANVAGTVALDVVIAADGRVQTAHAISGPDLLTESAVDAVKLWRFQPYKFDGKPIPVEATLHLYFQR
jgi:TonB family protein